MKFPETIYTENILNLIDVIHDDNDFSHLAEGQEIAEYRLVRTGIKIEAPSSIEKSVKWDK